ncbi:tRNA (adenosine(37)-N6)-threonylcarbamoyltransferase complex ATPase subunit type 1 TsaE [Candidatus Magnetaquicoccus inordinatus]|uniref:tRNA (adenosine(37)-N6)-threonylcarbamoyltransferase complex ATPase subunit type 1 TsaE n=1 Tax=Candidatus Magnetaquicoccus inordinatus TaxID=2496818 RepID=UPI00187D32F8|nr:tRNA (adenosine(37)-N6)-threonylcarbamoyltransferase complex ATPase subunit type 1 TsaE [Candidatus Magnetaquicoccus inordinatus]
MSLSAPRYRHLCLSETATRSIAKRLATALHTPLVILLEGDLGSGKTLFARSLIEELGIHEESITSPTFTLVNSYPDARLPLHHFDLYRIGDPSELDLIGMEEYLDEQNLVLIEWPALGGSWIPAHHLHISLEYVARQTQWRQLTFTAHGPLAQQVLHRFLAHDSHPYPDGSLSGERPGGQLL